MMKQTSIADGSDQSRPYAERGWQYEVWDPTEARNEVPYDKEDGEGDKSENESFVHGFSKLQSSRKAQRILSSTLRPRQGWRLEHMG